MEIKKLRDLNQYKSAPVLSCYQVEILLDEINTQLKKADWLTIGIMASSDFEAIEALKSFNKRYKTVNFNNFENLKAFGNVFLKGNQKSGEIYIRSENGLGEGILLTCQYDDQLLDSKTYGPFPLKFFEF